MEKVTPDNLSAEELRERLFHSLRDRGILGNLKSQLRNSLVNELQHSFKGRLVSQEFKIPADDSLFQRAVNSLIVDHLQSSGYDYTTGVFLPECGLAQDKVLSKEDFLQLLHISSQSKLYKQLVLNDSQSGKGFLWKILSNIAVNHAGSTQELGVQTDLFKEGSFISLDKKLEVLDNVYTNKRDEMFKSSNMLTEERLLNYQKQLEDRYQAQLKQEIGRMRENELTRLRVEEKEKCRKELNQLHKDLSKDYQSKYDAMLIRERNATERLQKEQEIRDKELYANRKSLQNEIEAVQKQEAEMKRYTETVQREQRCAEERVKAKDEELRRREFEIKRQALEFNQRLENEMSKFKLEQQSNFVNRMQNLEIRETKVKEVERQIYEEKDKIQKYKDDIKDKTARVNELETFLQEARHKEISATRHNEYLNSKLRDMTDYSTLKEQSAVQRQELETLRNRLSEVLNMNERERGRQEELLREMRRPTPESLMMQRDLERAKENLRQEQLVAQQQKQLLEARLQDEIERNRELMLKFEEQTLQMKDMNRELTDLRQHLAVTNIALNSEVYRKSQNESSARSTHLSPRGVKHVEFEKDRSDHVLRSSQHDTGTRKVKTTFHTDDIYNALDYQLDLNDLNDDDLLSEDVSSATVNSSDVISGARYRLKNLEKEAKTLEKAYQNFQYNITNPSSLPNPTQTETNSARLRNISPSQSPIPHSIPLSSTPHSRSSKSQQVKQYSDDSFEELSGGSKDKQKTDPLLKFNLSNLSEDNQEKQVLERREKSSPITVADLDARPGSPNVVVVAVSESPSEPTPEERSPQNMFHSSPPFMPPVSLDDAWRTANEKANDKDSDIEREKAELERERLDNERQEREDERKKLEQEQYELEQKAKTEETQIGEKQDTEDIDPVMQQYMALVQQNRQEKDKEDTNKDRSKAEGSPIVSEVELSLVEDIKSAAESDDGFSW